MIRINQHGKTCSVQNSPFFLYESQLADFFVNQISSHVIHKNIKKINT